MDQPEKQCENCVHSMQVTRGYKCWNSDVAVRLHNAVESWTVYPKCGVARSNGFFGLGRGACGPKGDFYEDRRK